MPFSVLTNEQLMALLAEQPKMMDVPGVGMVWLEYSDCRSAELVIAASVFAGEGHGIWQLPVTVAGLPVIVKVEDRHSGRILEIIDPRKNGGVWPRTNHKA